MSLWTLLHHLHPQRSPCHPPLPALPHLVPRPLPPSPDDHLPPEGFVARQRGPEPQPPPTGARHRILQYHYGVGMGLAPQQAQQLELWSFCYVNYLQSQVTKRCAMTVGSEALPMARNTVSLAQEYGCPLRCQRQPNLGHMIA